MKRKRGNKKGKSKKLPVVVVNEPTQNVVSLNTEDNSGFGDIDNDDNDCGMEAETPSSMETDQPEKLASINSDRLINKASAKLVYGRVKVKIKTKTLQSQLTSSDVPTQSDTDKSSQQVGQENQGIVSEKMEDSANSLPDVNTAVSGNPSKKAGSIKIKSSRGFGSLGMNQCSNAAVVQSECTNQKEPGVLCRDPHYNEQELKAALAVIRKVMKMDSARPFNLPVDPVALGIHDYFDVIDTPMDFGTICKNLENGVRYKNSKDVFGDVQYIWENCSKYNGEGHHISELMKRVKKNFTKYWTEAGLYEEQPQEINGYSHEAPMESTMRCSTHGHSSLAGSIIDYPRHQQQHQMDLSQHQPYHFSRSYIMSYQQQKMPCQHQCQCQLRSGEQQTSHPQAGRNVGSAGHFCSPPPVEPMIRCSNHGPRFPVDPMTDYARYEQQDLTAPSQMFPQPSASYGQPRHLQQETCPVQLNSSQAQPSQPQVVLETGSAGQFCSPPPVESMIRCSKRGPPRCPVGPMTDYTSHEQQEQIGPSQMQFHHPPVSNVQPHQPQQGLSPSQPQTGLDMGNANSSSIRRTRGRGPTRCLDVWNMEGKISVSVNELGQPIGLEAPKLTNFLGTIARNGHMAPLNYVEWRALPDEIKEKMWQQVQSKFEIDPKSKSWVLKSIGKKWKDWKAELKANRYNTHKTDEERLADCDERVIRDQWRILISFWNSKEAKERSVTNKASRAQQKITHTTGRKSFAQVREEQRVKRPDKKEPSRAELFILTRTRKDGQPVNKESSVLISQLRERAAQQKETSQNGTVEDDILSQVMGQDRHGRVRTYGLGPAPSDLSGPKPSRAEAVKMVSTANAEVHDMKEKMVSMEQTCAQMASQMSSMMSMMLNMQKKFPDEQGSPSELLHAGQVADVSNNSRESPQLQAHPPSLVQGVPSHQGRAVKRGKTQNAKRTVKRGKIQNASISSKVLRKKN
ncbi:uncharacterized protein LOC114280979 [Camellia sinensis]|uniref:uncharacterized protein LOC114280979 n=1 Tax=Camellia sinensis TaxID=4442 RepID=UPI0010361E3C|nr:uncharacterized protein LOC114280979 [Camellia sinensis]